jgi:hypothetical protein
MPSARRLLIQALFLLTVFLSAFLLFQVQPLISKTILPWFGGSPAVWTTCMLFFQVVLSGGYVYAHLLASRLSGRVQGLLHAGLLIAAVCCLPITPDESWKPDSNGSPVAAILLLLGATIGLPYFVLSSTGPLLQSWFLKAVPGKVPYRLYALSNAGSLLALISYPFVFEPLFAIGTQGSFWSWSFAGFAVCCGFCGIVAVLRPGTADVIHADDTPDAASTEIDRSTTSPTGAELLLWCALAAVPSTMLLATTNQVCTDIAVVPFLWVLPLSLYLLSFILCFDSDRWYSRKIFLPALLLCVVATCLLLWDAALLLNTVTAITPQAMIYFGLLFCCCMVCHGELVQLKPHPKYLTTFYLSMSIGGAMGGLFVGLIAPLVFQTLAELPVAIVATVALVLVVLYRDEASPLRGPRRRPVWLLASAGMILLTGAFYMQSRVLTAKAVAMSRNFYGVLRVEGFQDAYVMKHGQIRHGHQFRDATRRRHPTTYYGYDSGVGLVLRQHRADTPRRVGVIGLGAGTLAVYAQPGDAWRLYEINPEVVDMANEYFTYLSESKGDCEVVIADGRIALERESPQSFDVLVLDAFSGDAVPAHLLTRECGALYLKHLKADGILAMHITNRHLDLRPVCRGLAVEFGLQVMCTFTEKQPGDGTNDTLWFLMSRNAESLSSLKRGRASRIDPGPSVVLWTDQWTNLLSAMGRVQSMEILDDDDSRHITAVARPSSAAN